MTVRFTANPKAASLHYKPKTAGEKLFRKLDLNGAGLEAKPGSLKETLTVSATVATEHPVKRRDKAGVYLEVLSMAGCRFRATDDWPLQLDHAADSRSTVGRAHTLKVVGDTLTAQLRFSVADDVAPIVQRVADGSLKHLSVGYVVHRWVESVENGQRTKTAAEWTVTEVSLTPTPADPNSKIQRSTEVEDIIELTTAQVRAEIRTICRATNMPAEQVDTLIDEEATVDDAKAAAYDHIQSKRSATPRIRVTTSNDDPAAIVTRASDALAHRMGAAELPEASREFAGMSLLDMARDSLTRSGVSVRGLSTDEVLQRAAHGTSDFPLVVSNAANKTLFETYKAAESPLKALARSRTLPNFKEANTLRLSGMGRLEKLSEHGEIVSTSRAESGEKMSLATYASAITLTRRLMIDDDANAFGDIVAACGQAATQTEADLLVSQLLGNPAMSDGTAVFHATRGNLSTGAALDETALSAARLAMRKRTDLDGKTLISATPKYLVVGPELETAAEKLLTAINAATTSDVNPFAGKLSLMVEPRITDDRWFVFADPARLPGLQYAYLSGQQGPQVQRNELWETLGVSFRVFEDFGAGWVDWRSAQMNPGA